MLHLNPNRLFKAAIYYVSAILIAASFQTGFATDMGFVKVNNTQISQTSVFSSPIDRVFNNQADSELSFESSQYPIVLAHGLFGTALYRLGVDYYYGVPQHLAKLGYQVYVTKVPAVAPIALRAKSLALQIDEILEETGAEKVNLIGHSMGGLDGRFLISNLGYADKIASLTTIGTPHMGTSIADVSIGKLAPSLTKLARKLVLKLMSLASGYEVTWDLGYDTISNLTRDYIEDVFNPANPYSNKVFYQSVGGRSAILPKKTANKDPVNPVLYTSFMILEKLEGSNDGLVGFKSSKMELPDNHSAIAADHLDQIGHPVVKAFISDNFDHKRFYTGIARDLASRGF